MFFKRKDTDDLTDDTVVDTQTIKLAEEDVEIGRRRVEGDTVRIETVTELDLVPLNAELRREGYDIQRVPKDEVVTVIPEVRKADGVTIIPVLEEKLVVTKQIVLREEIHLVPTHSVDTYEDSVEVRRQRAIIERVAPD